MYSPPKLQCGPPVFNVSHLYILPRYRVTESQILVLLIWWHRANWIYSSSYGNLSCDDMYLSYLQAIMMADHSPMHGSRNLIDRYRDMRLDVDNMNYEVIITSSTSLLSFGLSQLLLTINYWLRAGATCSRRKNRACKHWLVWEYDFKVFNGETVFFFRT